MEKYRARSSFEKSHGEAPPRLQVIGFNVCAPAPIKADTQEDYSSPIIHEAPSSPLFENKPSPSLPKPASSPRSALQQLLLNQSLPSTSPPSANHSSPPGFLPLPPSPSGLLTPATSSPSTNHNLTSGLQPAISPPAANQNWTSGVSNPLGQPLKSLLQSENDVPASRTSLFIPLGQSQCASSSSSGNQSMRGASVSVNVQMINQHNPKPSQAAPIKEKYEAFFRIKQTVDDEACYEEKKICKNGNDSKTHEIKGRLISAKEVINELPHVENSNKSSWQGVQQIPFGNDKSRKSSWNEEKSKKSSLFMFVVSSPAPEFHRHHHHGEYNMSPKDVDFLSSCHLCRRFLRQDEDVFMYNGDKAFCSMECRYQQIVIDERKERCPPPIIRSGASQVYQHTSITTATTTHHPIMINKPHFINTAAAA